MLSYAHCIREDPVRKGLLYLGTENALYVSFDDGKNWQPLQTGLPHAPVYWIAVQERFHDLALATYGRGFWILDDITPLQQLTPEVLRFECASVRAARRLSLPACFAAGCRYLRSDRGAQSTLRRRDQFLSEVQAGEKERAESRSATPAAKSCARSSAVRLERRAHGVRRRQVRAEAGARRKAAPAPCEVKPGINRVWWNLRTERARKIKLRTPPTYSPDVPLGREGLAGRSVGRPHLAARAAGNVHGHADGGRRKVHARSSTC